MPIAGIGADIQTYVSTSDTQAKQQQPVTLPVSQSESQQNTDLFTVTPSGTGNNDSVKVTITNAGKDMLNNAQQNAKAAGGDKDLTSDMTDLAQGINPQSGTNAKDKNPLTAPNVSKNSMLSNSAYYAVQNNTQDNTQSVVVKIVDSNGNIVREIPPEDLLKKASELNITPNYLYHSMA